MPNDVIDRGTLCMGPRYWYRPSADEQEYYVCIHCSLQTAEAALKPSNISAALTSLLQAESIQRLLPQRPTDLGTAWPDGSRAAGAQASPSSSTLLPQFAVPSGGGLVWQTGSGIVGHSSAACPILPPPSLAGPAPGPEAQAGAPALLSECLLWSALRAFLHFSLCIAAPLMSGCSMASKTSTVAMAAGACRGWHAARIHLGRPFRPASQPSLHCLPLTP